MRAIRPSKKGWAFRNQTTRLIWSRRPTTVVSESLPVLARIRGSRTAEGRCRGNERLGQLPVLPAFLRRCQAVGRDDARRPVSSFLRRLRDVEHGRDPVVSERNPDGNFNGLDRSQRDEILLMETATVENASL